MIEIRVMPSQRMEVLLKDVLPPEVFMCTTKSIEKRKCKVISPFECLRHT